MKSNSMLWRLSLLVVSVCYVFGIQAQTNPAPQALPYAQDFSALAHSSTDLPDGWQGWAGDLLNDPSPTYQVAAPMFNRALRASSTAATTQNRIHNYDGKIGVLQTTNDMYICLSISTLGREAVQVDHDVMTIRNPYDGATDTRIGALALQYRIGESGDFTNLSGTEYQSNTTTQTGPVTTPQNLQSISVTLPPACNDQAVVQLRWVVRDVSGTGDRPSFAVDNVVVDGCRIPSSFSPCQTWVSPSPTTGYDNFNTLFGGAPCDYNGSGCPFYEISTFEIFADEAYAMDNVQVGGTYTISACNGVGGTAWPITYTILTPSGAVDAFGLDPCSICSLTWTASESGTYLIVISEEGACGTSTNAAVSNGFPAITCVSGAACNSACEEWQSPSPTTGYINFNTLFGGAPCSQGTIAPVNEITAFQIWAEEAYAMNNIAAGGEYTFSACNGVGGTAWPISYSIIAPSGAVDAFGLNTGSICALTWTASESGTYHIVVTEGGACGYSTNTNVDNGFPAITCTPSAATACISVQFQGGDGRGDVADSYVNTPLPSSIFYGGDGRGDVADSYVNTPIPSNIYTGGDGRGDEAFRFQNALVPSNIFSGGDGRGDVALRFQNALVPSNIFSGGDGRGDVALRFQTVPEPSNIFAGGAGRGDVVVEFLNTPVPSNIFAGGSGRGDASREFVAFPQIYYSQSNGSTSDPIWSRLPVGTPGLASWGPLASMVVQNGHSVTVPGLTAVENLSVTSNSTLTLQSGSELVVSGSVINVGGSVIGDLNSAMTIDGANNPNTGLNFEYSNAPGYVQLFDLNLDYLLDLQGPIGITGTLQLFADAEIRFNSGYDPSITLLSTASATGRIGPVPPSASFNGTITIERYIPGGATNWRLLGSPIQNQTVQHWQDDFITAGYPGSHYPNFFDPPGSGNFWPSIRWYDETDPGAQASDGLQGVSSSAQALSQGQGFAVWCGDNLGGTAPFVVDLGDAPPRIANTPIALPMSWTNTGTPTVDGWNLVSNPVPSAIAFDQIARGADVEDYVTFYNPANGNTSVYDIGLGFGTNGATNTIQSSQGFFLKATGPNVATSVEEDDKINDNGGGFFGLTDPPPMLRMQVTSGINQFSDESLVVFHVGAPELEVEDVLKYVLAHPTAPQLSSLAPDGTPLAINAYGTHAAGMSIPLSVNAAVTGTYTLALTEVGELGFNCVALHDLLTGTITPLVGYTTYSFTVNANDDPAVPRFLLRTTAPVASFTAPAVLAAGEALSPTNTSVDGVNYLWNFGDGTTSTEAQPTHNYLIGGSYEVSLTATAGNCSSIALRTVVANTASLPLSAKLMLQGPYDAGTGLMRDDLRLAGLVPLAEPYTALGYPFAGGGGESTNAAVLAVAGSNAIVDWVVVELRDANDAGLVLESRCGLVQRDGDVVGINGVSPLAFGQNAGSYFVTVLHRNHLGAMTRTAIPMDTSGTALDLTTAPTFGNEARTIISGGTPTEALWAGDVTFDGTIKYTGASNDRDPILQAVGGNVATNTATGYLQGDVNMDGTAKYTGAGNDRDILLQNIGGVVPTNVRVEQLP